MSKRDLFLSAQNVAAMTKRVWHTHQREGGSLPLSGIHVAGLMYNWSNLDYIDSYESLVHDPESEMDQINQEFYREIIEQFLPAGGFARVNKLETVDDYLNFDIQRDAPPVTAAVRRGSHIPINRKPAPRRYENDGVHGRSLSVKNKEIPGMNELWEHVNRPYPAIDRNEVQYYGQHEDEGSTILTAGI